MNDKEHAHTALRIARAWLARIEAIAPDDTNAQRHAAMDRFAVRDRLFAIQLNLPDPVFSFAIAAVHDAIGRLNHEQRTPEEWRRGVALIADEVAILADLIGDDEPAATMGTAPAGDDAPWFPATWFAKHAPALSPQRLGKAADRGHFDKAGGGKGRPRWYPLGGVADYWPEHAQALRAAAIGSDAGKPKADIEGTK